MSSALPICRVGVSTKLAGYEHPLILVDAKAPVSFFCLPGAEELPGAGGAARSTPWRASRKMRSAVGTTVAPIWAPNAPLAPVGCEEAGAFTARSSTRGRLTAERCAEDRWAFAA